MRLGILLRSCFLAFDTLLKGLSNVPSSTPDHVVLLRNELDRLRLWAHDIEIESCDLDAKLSQSAELREFATQLLSDLHETLQSESDSPLDAIFDEVQDIIDNLINLEEALQNPAPLDYCSRTAEITDVPSGISIGRKRSIDEVAEYSQEASPLPKLPTPEPAVKAVSQGPTVEFAQVPALLLLGQLTRSNSGTPDVDIVAVHGAHGRSSWDIISKDEHGDRKQTAESVNKNWLQDILLGSLKRRNIYARMFSFVYDTKMGIDNDPSSLESTANSLVGFINTWRTSEPDRPLVFICHSIGGIIAKRAISVLIREGLSVSSEDPPCACLFYGTPHTTSGTADMAKLLSWLSVLAMPQPVTSRPSTMRRILAADLHPLLTRILTLNKEYLYYAQFYKIPQIDCYETRQTNQSGSLLVPRTLIDIPEQYSTVRVWPVDSDHFLLANWRGEPHQDSSAESDLPNTPEIEQLADLLKDRLSLESTTVERIEDPRTSVNSTGSEDSFAMLMTYNSAFIIDTTLSNSSMWNSVVDLLRDSVDIICNYANDVDVQMGSTPIQCFSVDDSSKASKILSEYHSKDKQWDASFQIEAYLMRYLSSPSSIQENGFLRPCNIIVITASLLENVETMLDMFERVEQRARGQHQGVLEMRIQFVLGSQDTQVVKSFDDTDECVRNSHRIGRYLAPVTKLQTPYGSNADVCKRILLGAISPRFSLRGIIDPGYSSQAFGGNWPASRQDPLAYISKARRGLFGNALLMNSGTSVPDSGYGSNSRSTEGSVISAAASEGTGSYYGYHPSLPYGYFQNSPTINDPLLPQAVSPMGIPSESMSPRESGSKRTEGRIAATFQCHLCPKRFQRAYNLRSHLRTHLDERPFVCTICGKAFARQHDRKRHEGLHSGEKKFVCRGALAHGFVSWGCGRRFARVDALARHFRSDAGRDCIKPLIEEERGQKSHGDHDALRDIDFPAALLEQYPALSGVVFNVDTFGSTDFSERFDTEELIEPRIGQLPTIDRFQQLEATGWADYRYTGEWNEDSRENSHPYAAETFAHEIGRPPTA